jgi:hypothetical protein
MYYATFTFLHSNVEKNNKKKIFWAEYVGRILYGCAQRTIFQNNEAYGKTKNPHFQNLKSY